MKKKIILMAVNAQYIHSNLAVFCLRAYARKCGYHTEILEFTINQRKEQILRELYRTKPAVLAVSVYIWNVALVERVLRDFSVICPETEIWLGGPEVSYLTETFLRDHPYVRGIMRGEGEETFADLCRYWQMEQESGEKASDEKKSVACVCDEKAVDWEKGSNPEREENLLNEITGITWRDSLGGIHNNADRICFSLDQLPFPYEGMEFSPHRIIYYESSRGCPFSCAYCLSSVEKRMRFRSLEKVFEELQFFLDRKVAQVKFVDRTFNCDHRHAMAIWQYLREHDNGVTNFHFEIGADLLTEEEIHLIGSLRKGQIQLEIGIQTTNARTMQAIRRTAEFERIRKNVAALQKAENVHLHLDLIAGLPYENLQSFRRSFCMVYQMRPQQLQLGFLKVLKGAAIYDMAGEFSCSYEQEAPYEVLQTDCMSYGDLLECKGVEEMLEVYYNSHQFERAIERLEVLFSDSYQMYQCLAAFYRERGYENISVSRPRRFEILREFLSSLGQKEDFLDQELRLDLYSRENLKNRPAWAERDRQTDDWARDFYQMEEKTHRYLPEYANYNWKQLRSMTHIEYAYDRYWLFDYQRRNPLNGNAEVCEIELQISEKQKNLGSREMGRAGKRVSP